MTADGRQAKATVEFDMFADLCESECEKDLHDEIARKKLLRKKLKRNPTDKEYMEQFDMEQKQAAYEKLDEDCENEDMEGLWGRITQDFVLGKMSTYELHKKYFDEFLSHRQWEIEDEFSNIIKNLTKGK